MNRFLPFVSSCCLIACVLFPALARGDDDVSLPDVDAQSQEAARRAWLVLEAVLDNHVAPPTRQQMVLTAASELWTYSRKDEPLDRATARRISELTGQSEIEAFLSAQLSSASKASGKTIPQLEKVLIHSALREVPGDASYMSSKESIVQQQVLANRYVGIGIALGMKDGWPAIMKVFHRGPAHREGAIEEDLMVSIDGASTAGKSLEDVISLLRGQAGTSVSIVVRQPESEETRTLKITRGEVPIETVVGRERIDNDHWDYSVPNAKEIAYVKISSIRGSTVNELRDTARKLQSQGFRAVILDLQQVESGELRHAVMMADLLLEGGPIGSALIRGRREIFTSNDESLFREWPMAVLIGEDTEGQAEWIAACLKQRRDTLLMGARTLGKAYVTEHIPLADGAGIRLRTGVFHRPDGYSLVTPNLDEAHILIRRLSEEIRQLNRQERPKRVDSYLNGVTPDVLTSGDPTQAAAKLAEKLDAASALKGSSG